MAPLAANLYVSDTVALARYLEDDLPKKANEVFEMAEAGKATILVPDIVIAEFIYIGLKGRLKFSDPRAIIGELLSDLQSSPYLLPVGVSSEAWNIYIDSMVPELHDRLIYSVALASKVAAIITNDPGIIASGYPTIW
jgi:predicted nucleic acid-binding protein